MADRTSGGGSGQVEDGAARIQEAWRRELPDLPDPSIESIGVITRIWRLAKILDDQRRRTLEQLGTDASTLDLLSTLRRSGRPYRMNVSAISEQSLVTQGAVSQRVARAESAGLVRRVPSPSDGRSMIVALTAKGRRLNEQSVRRLLAREADLLAALPARQRAELAAALEAVLVDLTARTGAPDRPDQRPSSVR